MTFAPPPGYTLEKYSSHHQASHAFDELDAPPKTFQERLLNFLQGFSLGAIAGGLVRLLFIRLIWSRHVCRINGPGKRNRAR